VSEIKDRQAINDLVLKMVEALRYHSDYERAQELITTFEARVRAEERERQNTCWHCGDLLIPSANKPRCEQCPNDCDEENCEAMGCETIRARALEQGGEKGD
jgi:hypothetical protein